MQGFEAVSQEFGLDTWHPSKVHEMIKWTEIPGRHIWKQPQEGRLVMSADTRAWPVWSVGQNEPPVFLCLQSALT